MKSKRRNSEKKQSIRRHSTGHNGPKLIIFLILVAPLALVVLFSLSPEVDASAMFLEAADPTAVPSSEVHGLAYLQSDMSGEPARIKQKPSVNGKIDNLLDPATISEIGLMEAKCMVDQMVPSPKGQWIAVQVNCEDFMDLFVINTANGAVEDVFPELGREMMFLNWGDNGHELVALADPIYNPCVYLLNLANHHSEALPLPKGVYHVAISRNHKRIFYAFSHGLGSGSELWEANLNGNNARQILADSENIIAYAVLSPSEDEIAFVRIPDNNVPFPESELWIMQSNGSNQHMIGKVDGGRGNAPTWSPDGKKIAFVHRKNSADLTADQQYDGMISDIYLYLVEEDRVLQITSLPENQTENPTWSPDGGYVAFSAHTETGSSIWAYDINNRQNIKVVEGPGLKLPGWLVKP